VLLPPPLRSAFSDRCYGTSRCPVLLFSFRDILRGHHELPDVQEWSTNKPTTLISLWFLWSQHTLKVSFLLLFQKGNGDPACGVVAFPSVRRVEREARFCYVCRTPVSYRRKLVSDWFTHGFSFSSSVSELGFFFRP